MKSSNAQHLRPNHRRGIKIYGGIKGEFAKIAFQKIAILANRSAKPVTLYIKSQGGSVGRLKSIEELFSRSNPSRQNVLFITVAVGDASSAAAFLLLMGHFAYATAAANIVFHGARYQVIHPLAKIKKGDAISMGLQLDKQNRRIAENLAQAIVYRVIHRYLEYKNKTPSIEGAASPLPATGLRKFVKYLNTRLSSPRGKVALEQSFAFTKTILSLRKHFAPRIPEGSSVTPAAQGRIFKAIISIKLSAPAKINWCLDETTTPGIMFDYLFFNDLMAKDQAVLLKNLAKSFGTHFLSPPEANVYNDLKKDSFEAQAFLLDRVKDQIAVLWYFTMALTRRLLTGETNLSASDAYWLGLIDEVLDTPLTWQPIAGEKRRRYFNGFQSPSS